MNRRRPLRLPRSFTARALEAAATIRKGASVSWKASKGEARGVVVSIHKSARVPGVPHLQEATEDAPAARVQLYAKVGKSWEATNTFLGLPVAALELADFPIAEGATEAVTGSFEAIRDAVRSAICERIEALAGVEAPYIWICDIGASWAVFEAGGDLYLVTYSWDEASLTASLSGEFQEVRRVVSYEPAATEACYDELGLRSLEAAGSSIDGGRIFHVLLIAYGDSKNGRRYPEAVLRRAAALYEGAKAYDHHRTEAELITSTTVGLVGTFRNITAGSVGLEADLYLLPSATHTAEALDMALANAADGLDVFIGLSQDVTARWQFVTDNGRTLQEATEILTVHSVDVVAHPAAGGVATRMVASHVPTTTNPTTTVPPSKETPVTLRQFLEALRALEAAQRAAFCQQNASVLTEAGLTADDAIRMAEAITTPAATAAATAPATEAVAPQAQTFVRGSILARTVVSQALAAAGMDAAHMTEAVLTELPASFTEADLQARIGLIGRLLEGAERGGLAPTIPAAPAGSHEGDLDKKIAALDAMLAGNFREGFRSFKQAYVEVTSSLGRPVRHDLFSEDMNRQILRESLVMRRDGANVAYDSNRAIESLDSTSWGEILGDSITRRVVAEYGMASLQTWRPVVSNIMPINDFRTQRITRYGGYGVLPTVLQGAPYQALTSPSDEEATYAVSKKGGTEDLTLEMITNDDLRQVVLIPQRMGRAAAQTLFRFVWDLFDTNPTIYDGTALFAAGHSNTDTNALSGANLSAGRKKMRKQKAYGDTYEVLSLAPKFLVVASDLEELAFQLSTSAVAMPSGAPVGAASNIPNLHQGITPIVVDYWTSTTAWYLVADPSLCPTIEVGFLGGQEDPAVFVQNDPTSGSAFSADKVTYKIRHIYGGNVIDYRGLYRGNT